MRITRTPALIAALTMTLTAAPVMAQGLTYQEEKADCQGDAMRLCGPYIPDQQKIRACLVAYKAYLSPACRSIVTPQKR